jgi:ATP-dependent DNA helicase RecQ
VIFSDVSLRHMARNYPQTRGDFRLIPGVGEQKLRTFAEPFLAAVIGHLREHGREANRDRPLSARAEGVRTDEREISALLD